WLDLRRAGHEPRSRVPISRAAPLLALGPLLAIVSFATPPLGLERLRGALAFARSLGASASGAASNPLLEWQPTYAAGLDASAWMRALFVAIGAASFAATRRPWRRARVAIFVGTALLGVSANRFVSVFALATAWLTLANLGDLSPSLAERLRAW